MRPGHSNFEVQVLRDGRWVTDSARDGEDEARQLAEKFLARKDCAGARVVANRLLGDGSMSETVIFEKTRTVSADKAVNIVTIDETPPLCEAPRDFFGLESRMVMNRIFRPYLEDVTLTPTEVLHSVNNLRRLLDKDRLVPSAVDHVAKLQITGTDRPARGRQDEIYAHVDQIADRAARADGLDMPDVADDFAAVLAKVDGIGGESAEYLAMVVLARDLMEYPSWLGKLDRLCRLAAAETDAKAVLLLDTVIADVLGANVVQELLGWQRSLGSAIIAMLDLADGRFDPDNSDAREVADMLNGLFARGALPAGQRVMVDRALRQLKSSQPLYRADPAREMEEYQRVLERLMVPGGILSGAQAAEALTLRGTRFVEQGGATGRRAAIGATVEALPDPARGVMYLSELSNTEFAEGHLDDIVAELDSVFGARVIDELCRRATSAKERMVTATGAFRATASSALPDDVKNQVTDHIDDVLERYLVDENSIEKLDHPDTHIRDRAVRLVKFCGAGVLPEGKALTLARARVVGLLRQKNFDAHFIEGIKDPRKAEKALRDFHKLLVKAGIA